MTIKDRILSYLKKQGISREEFYKETGLSASNFKGAALNSELGGEKIVRILSIYKQISPDWLLLGEGSMLRDSKSGESDVAHKPSASPISPIQESIIYNMYKEKDAKVEELLKENGRLEERIRQLESQDNKSEHHIIMDQVAEAFTAESSGAYVKSSSLTRKNSISETSSEERI